MKTVYLSLPYSKIDFNKSFEISAKVSAQLMNRGYRVFSPITLCHPIAEHLKEELRTDSKFWLDQDLYWIEHCDELFVVVIGEKGMKLVKKSVGCQAEIKRAKELNKPITYLYYE